MKILFFFSHPAQYLFLRETIKRLINNNHSIVILIKTKDVLQDLIKNDYLDFINILPRKRGRSKLSVIFSLIKRNFKILPVILKRKPDLMVGTDASIAQLGKLLNINRITITEDDYSVIKNLGILTYPFTKTILCPIVCNVGKWENKKVGYNGYMKLGYLHPTIFNADPGKKEKYNLPDKYILIRLAKLTAHHDFGIKGITYPLLEKLISVFEEKSFRVYISSEDLIHNKYKKYLLKINPNDMHHILASSYFLVCDSQSMSVEAAMLGIPSIRFSGFAGRISVLEELEHKYKLTFGIDPENPEKLISKLNELLSLKNLKNNFQDRRKEMLTDKIDVTAFMVWFIENYPESAKIMKENPDYQYNFK